MVKAHLSELDADFGQCFRDIKAKSEKLIWRFSVLLCVRVLRVVFESFISRSSMGTISLSPLDNDVFGYNQDTQAQSFQPTADDPDTENSSAASVPETPLFTIPSTSRKRQDVSALLVLLHCRLFHYKNYTTSSASPYPCLPDSSPHAAGCHDTSLIIPPAIWLPSAALTTAAAAAHSHNASQTTNMGEGENKDLSTETAGDNDDQTLSFEAPHDDSPTTETGSECEKNPTLSLLKNHDANI
ncbi:hypothetical protein ABVT39_003501 [Epinephelus coioides]